VIFGSDKNQAHIFWLYRGDCPEFLGVGLHADL
jgi:hypothetical protein